MPIRSNVSPLRCLRSETSRLSFEDQPVRLERLFDEIICAPTDGRHHGFDVAVTGNHHHWQVGMQGLDFIEQGQAVEPRALQPDVEEDEARRAVSDRGQRAVRVVRRAGFVAFVAQDTRHQFTDVFFVVDDQNIRRHYRPSQFLVRFPPVPGHVVPYRREG